MSAHAEDSLLAAVPYAFDIDIVCEIPDLLGRVNGVCVIAAGRSDKSNEPYRTLTVGIQDGVWDCLKRERSLHNSSIIEHDVHTAPIIQILDHSLDIGFFRDITFDCLDSGRIGQNGVDL